MSMHLLIYIFIVVGLPRMVIFYLFLVSILNTVSIYLLSTLLELGLYSKHYLTAAVALTALRIDPVELDNGNLIKEPK